jgi:hypothetical protein
MATTAATPRPTSRAKIRAAVVAQQTELLKRLWRNQSFANIRAIPLTIVCLVLVDVGAFQIQVPHLHGAVGWVITGLSCGYLEHAIAAE